ncbi:transglycosylase domain-containing protein [Hutsoniella sourekii]
MTDQPSNHSQRKSRYSSKEEERKAIQLQRSVKKVRGLEQEETQTSRPLPSPDEIDQERQRRRATEQSENIDLSEDHLTYQNKTKPKEPQSSDKIKEKRKKKAKINLQDKWIRFRKKAKDEASNPYSLSQYDGKQKTLFGFNVTLNILGKLFLYLLLLVLLGAALVAGTGLGYFANLVGNTEPPSHQEMSKQLGQLDQQSTLFYNSGQPIANVQTDLVRTNIQLDQVAPDVINGFLATEDEYFKVHKGIVPKAILRAALQTLLTGSGTGGSTITQQLVKQQMLSNDVTFFRKANEILLALRVENHFDKDEILTAYLNVSPFGRNNKGENIAGIEEAAQGIFGKSAKDVNLNQAAFLAGLPQDPYSYTPYQQDGQLREDLSAGIKRMKEVLFRMYREQFIDKSTYEQALNYDITQDFIAPQARQIERQSYLYQAVLHGAIEKIMHLNIEKDGYTWQQVYQDDDWYNDYYNQAEQEIRTSGYQIYSTIDKEIYDQLQISAKEYEDQLGVTYDGVYVDPETGQETYYVEKVQTGLVMIDNQTGKVLGFIAGTDYENNQIDHAFQMRRSPGSTIKPLAVYGPAMEHNIVNPATIVPDTAFYEVYEDGSSWAPTNYGNYVSNEFMSVRTALYKSDNIPAVRIYQELLNQGVPIIDYLSKMGFNIVDSYTKEDTENLAFSLGGVTTGPTVFEETRAFSTFANGGNYHEGYLIEKIVDSTGHTIFQQEAEPVRVFSEDTNYQILDILRDTMTQGTGRTANEWLEVPGDWIAKSGISENSKDIWMIGSTPTITIGSWIGYDSRYQDYSIDINDGYDRESVRSQTYWAKIVNDIYRIRPDIFGSDQQFTPPSSVQKQTILEATGTLPGNITINGNQISITGPTREDWFKVTHPAPSLHYDFMFNATDEDHARFWSEYLDKAKKEAELRRQEANSSSQSDQNSSSNQDESVHQDEASRPNPDEESPPVNPNQVSSIEAEIVS